MDGFLSHRSLSDLARTPIRGMDFGLCERAVFGYLLPSIILPQWARQFAGFADKHVFEQMRQLISGHPMDMSMLIISLL